MIMITTSNCSIAAHNQLSQNMMSSGALEEIFVLELSIERDFYYYLSLFHFSSVTPACLLDFRKDRRY